MCSGKIIETKIQVKFGILCKVIFSTKLAHLFLYSSFGIFIYDVLA